MTQDLTNEKKYHYSKHNNRNTPWSSGYRFTIDGAGTELESRTRPYWPRYSSGL